MRRARIRWRNVFRLLGGFVVMIAALALGPELLRPPELEPLPADVGLEIGHAGVHAPAPNGRTRPPPERQSADREPDPRERARDDANRPVPSPPRPEPDRRKAERDEPTGPPATDPPSATAPPGSVASPAPAPVPTAPPVSDAPVTSDATAPAADGDFAFGE